MYSSVPNTTRPEEPIFEQQICASRYLKNRLLRNFNEPRPTNCTQPTRAKSRDTLRTKRAPLRVTDERIVQLLRRGAISAREEYLGKSNIPLKVTASKRPTEALFTNFYWGDDKNCVSRMPTSLRERLKKSQNHLSKVADLRGMKKSANVSRESIRTQSDLESVSRNQCNRYMNDSNSRDRAKNRFSGTTLNKEPENNGRNEGFEPSVFTRSEEPLEKCSSASNAPPIESIRRSKRTGSSRSVDPTHKSLQSSMAELRSVLDKTESKSRELRPAVPRLDIRSREKSSTMDSELVSNGSVSSSVRAAKYFLEKPFFGCGETSSANSRVEPGPSALKSSLLTSGSKENSARDLDIDSLIRALTDVSSKRQLSSTRDQEPSSSSCRTVPNGSRLKHEKETDCSLPVSSRVADIGNCAGEILAIPERKKEANADCSKDTEGRAVQLVKIYSPPMRRSRQALSAETSSPRKKCSTLHENEKSSESSMESCEKLWSKSTTARSGPVEVWSEPNSCIHDERSLHKYFSSLTAPSNDRRYSKDRFMYLRRENEIPCSRRSSSDSSSEVDLQRNETRTNFQYRSSDKSQGNGKFNIYEDADGVSVESESVSCSETLDQVVVVRQTSDLSCGPQFNKIKGPPDDLRKNENIFPDKKRKDVSWTDSSSGTDRTVASPLDSNRINFSKKLSHQISPRNTSRMDKSPTCSSGSSSTKSSEKSSTLSRPSRLCSNNEAPPVSENPTVNDFQLRSLDLRAESKDDHIFDVDSVAKRLSYSENKEEHAEKEERASRIENRRGEEKETLFTEELIDDSKLSSSGKNMSGNGRSDGAVHFFRSDPDYSAVQLKNSCSMRTLTNVLKNTEVDRSNLDEEIARQGVYSFVTSKTADDSSFRANKIIHVSSSNSIVESTYKLAAHPSLLRLASAGIELTPGEIIQTASQDPDVRASVRKSSWFRRVFGSCGRSGKGERTEKKSTRILYRNKDCRDGSPDGSMKSEKGGSLGNVKRRNSKSEELQSLEMKETKSNRDGLWMKGLENEVNFKDERRGDSSSKLCDGGERENDEERNRHFNFLWKSSKGRKNPGCFCTPFCLFFIGRNVHSVDQSPLLFRRRRSRIRRFDLLR